MCCCLYEAVRGLIPERHFVDLFRCLQGVVWEVEIPQVIVIILTFPWGSIRELLWLGRIRTDFVEILTKVSRIWKAGMIAYDRCPLVS